MIRSIARWGLASALALALGASCGSSTPAGTGGARQACYANGTCNTGLICLSNVCVAPPDGGAGMMGVGGVGGAAGGAGTSAAGTSGGAGAAAGAAGADAAAGSTGGADAAAGSTGGDDAAAGSTGGADAATDSSHGDTAADTSGAAGADAGSCPYKAAYGNVIIASSLMQAQEHVTPATAQAPATDEVDWTGVIRNASTPDQLVVQLVNGFPPFDTTITTMSIDLTTQNDFQTCGACVTLYLALDGQTPPAFLPTTQTFIASRGTLNVTAIPTFPAAPSSRITGSLSNVVFEHVTIDPGTGLTTKVDDCQVSVTSAAFDAIVTNH